jgi:hypothetical protein
MPRRGMELFFRCSLRCSLGFLNRLPFGANFEAKGVPPEFEIVRWKPAGPDAIVHLVNRITFGLLPLRPGAS